MSLSAFFKKAIALGLLNQRFLPPSTWATGPAAASYSGYAIRITDVGPSTGSLWISDGTYWKPLNGYCLLWQLATGWLLPGISANSNASRTSGVVTVVNGAPTAHNIPATTYDGYQVYYPGSASLTAGWYSGFTRTSTTAYTFNAAGADFGSESINGAAAYINIATVAVNVPVLASSMALNGSLRCNGRTAMNNTANTKTLTLTFGGTTVIAFGQTSVTNSGVLVLGRNRGVANKQVWPGLAAENQTNNNNVYSAIDTTSNQNLAFLLTLTTAADFITLEGGTVELLSS